MLLQRGADNWIQSREIAIAKGENVKMQGGFVAKGSRYYKVGKLLQSRTVQELV